MRKGTRHRQYHHPRAAELPRVRPMPPMLIANWKMNLTPERAVRAARGLVRDLGDLGSAVRLVVAPSHAALAPVGRVLEGSTIALGAQDAFWEDTGSFTGEVSSLDVKELGAEYVILGHSERRANLGETDDMVNRKMLAVVRHGLTPIVCVGEHFEDRRRNQQDVIVMRQVQAAFRNVRPPFRGHEYIIAYEPLWAIGTGDACDPAEAGRMAEVIQYALLELYDERIVRDTMRIIYGGSATALNIRAYLTHTPLSGSLVGGASLAPASFLAMAAASAPRVASPADSRAHHPRRTAHRRRSHKRK